MTDYVFFNISEAQKFIKDHPTIAGDPATRIDLSVCKNARPEDIICIAAVDKNRLIGRMLFTYGFILDNGEPLRVAAAQDLFVSKIHQGKGIGVRLIKKSLEICIPCIYSGMSGGSRPIVKKLGFPFIDESPIFQVPLTLMGVLKDARHRLYAMKNNHNGNLFAAVSESMSAKKRLFGAVGKHSVLDSKSAIMSIDEILSANVKRFQIPWNMELIRNGIIGKSTKYNAFVVEIESLDRYFVSIYEKKSQFRLMLSNKFIDLKDGHVNEIYPPLVDQTMALLVLNAIAIKARQLGYKNLSVYASTHALQSACQKIGLESRHKKTIAIEPINLPDNLGKDITDPDQWWCRAMNENQIEESQIQPS